MKETSRIKLSFIHATRGGWEQLPLLKDQLLESQEKLLKAYKELLVLEEEKEREAALAKAREASRKAVEEAALLRERTTTVEEAASKAQEEAKFYKDAATDLDKKKADLASARAVYQEMKVECVKGKIARSAAEEAEKKALKDLEAE